MSYGLTITNGANELTMSSDSVGYRYIGAASIYQNSVKTSFAGPGYTYGYIDPWIFEYQMSNSTDVPFFAIEVHSGIVVPDYSYHVGGGLWRFECHSAQMGAVAISDFGNVTLVTPVVRVFGPYTTGGNYGLIVYTDTGKVAFNAGQYPLLIKQVVSVPAAAYDISPPGTWTSTPSDGTNLGTLSDGVDVAASAATKPLIITGATGVGQAIQSISAEDIFYDRWGWSLVSGRLRRRRFILQRFARDDYDYNFDTYNANLDAGSALIIEGNNF